MDESSDVVQELLHQWRRERPELDVSAMAVVGRLLRLGKRLETRANVVLKPFGLSYTDLDVLATLRRSGKPYSLKPTQLQRSVLITSGAMTACLNRLEAAGLISRSASDQDRRSLSAALTTAGRRLVDKAVEVRFAEAHDALKALAAGERKQLGDLLRKMDASVHGY